jgi:hypothetical protein
MDERWETREQLLAAAKAARHPVSASQLGRLYRAGLIPAPQIRALGRGRGTESRYPSGTAARLVRVMEIHTRERRLAHTGWRLWWEDGGAIPPPARKLLTRVARSVDEERDRLAALLAGDEAGTPAAVAEMDQLYADAENDRVRGPLGEARRNVGRERFATVVRVIAQVGAGRFAARDFDGYPDDAGRLVDRALGLERARTDRRAGSVPWLASETGVDLAMLSEIVASRSLLDVAENNDSQLDLARVEIQSLIGVVTAVAPLLERLHGRGAFGLGMMSRLFGVRNPSSQALILLGWLALRSNDAFRAGLDQITAVAPQATATAQLYGLISQLRQEVAVLAPVLTDERLATAQLDENAAIELNSEIARLREHNTDSFNAFFAAHPEAEDLISVIDANREAVRGRGEDSR